MTFEEKVYDAAAHLFGIPVLCWQGREQKRVSDILFGAEFAKKELQTGEKELCHVIAVMERKLREEMTKQEEITLQIMKGRDHIKFAAQVAAEVLQRWDCHIANEAVAKLADVGIKPRPVHPCGS